MRNLFVYGTLMRPETMERFVDSLPESTPAVLEGFRCGMVGSAHFPGITPDEDRSVNGIVYMGVTDKDFTRLDRYEGCPTLYKRETVTVLTEMGEMEAEVYVYQHPSNLLDKPFIL